MNRLKELRKAQGISQAELADRAGVSRQAISFYEKEKRHPKIETWQKMADVLDVSVNYVRGDIDTELIAKIAKMVFLIETTPFYTDYGFTNNLYENNKMVCSLMMLLLTQINLNCSQEFKTIILNAKKILNDKKFEDIYCSAKGEKHVGYQKAKQCIEHISGIRDKDNFEKDIEDAKKLIDFYDKL